MRRDLRLLPAPDQTYVSDQANTRGSAMNHFPSMTGKVWLVGAGPGDPELLTVKAMRVLKECTVWLVDDLVGPDVLALAPSCTRIVKVGKRGGCASTSQAFILRLMARYARQGHAVARLKGGKSEERRGGTGLVSPGRDR